MRMLALESVALLAFALLLAPASCQVATILYPFTGQGGWPSSLGRVIINVDVHLDRVLELNQEAESWRSVHRFHLTWRDPRAQAAVLNSTTAWFNSSGGQSAYGGCSLTCDASLSFEAGCCDNLWLPQIDLPNLLTFDYQTNPPPWRIWVEPLVLPDGSETGLVHWTVRLDGTWFSPYDFRAWPLEHQHLLLEMQPGMAIADKVSLVLGSHSGLVNTPHTKGVDLAGWTINSITPRMYDTSSCYTLTNTTSWVYDVNPSTGIVTPRIVMPPNFLYIGSNSTVVTTIPVEQCNSITNAEAVGQYGPFVLVLDMMMLRDKSFYVLVFIVPLTIVSLLVFVVYALDRTNLEARMGVIVTLVLALSALQFTYDFPPASYLNVVQQLSLLSYVLFALVCICCIITSSISRIHDRKRRHEAHLIAAGLKSLQQSMDLGSRTSLGLVSEAGYDLGQEDRKTHPRNSGLFFGATGTAEGLVTAGRGLFNEQQAGLGVAGQAATPVYPAALTPIAEVGADRATLVGESGKSNAPSGKLPASDLGRMPAADPDGVPARSLSGPGLASDPLLPPPHPYSGEVPGGAGQAVGEGTIRSAFTTQPSARTSSQVFYVASPSSKPLGQDLAALPPQGFGAEAEPTPGDGVVAKLTAMQRGRRSLAKLVRHVNTTARKVHSRIGADEAYAQLVSRQVDIATSLFLFCSYVIVVVVLIPVNSSVGDHKLMLAGAVAPGNM